VAFALSDLYGVVIAKNIMLPMGDGIRLAADIYRPAENGEPIAGQLPTILARTSYASPPSEVTGAITVQLWISSSTPDTDFTAKLIDEYPQGFAMNLVDSILRVRYREGWDHEVFMEPGTLYPITIQLPPTSNQFARRHRIRLDVSSSNFPRFDVNPNTGEPVGRHTHSLVATNTVHFGKSHVVLPVIP
jgi:putative CocE/NonD family hydrolase